MISINKKELNDANSIILAYSHRLRLELLAFIDQKKSVNVNNIYHALGLEQANTSKHLRVLRNAGIVLAQRKGKMMYYSIDYDHVAQNIKTIRKLLKA